MISFHSLEDRMVKQCIAAAARPAAAYARLPLRESEMPQPVLYSLGRVQAEDDEVAVNARARSAVLRAAERSATPLPAEGGAAFVHTGSLARQRPRRSAQGRKGRAPLMGRVNLIIAALLMLSAISLVTSRYQSRQLFVELGRIRRRSATWRSAGGGCSWSAPSWRVTRAWMPLRAIASR